MARDDEFREAVKRGDASAVGGFLRESPELRGAKDAHGKTGLHWAAETDQLEVARVLLDAGADLDARTTWNATPLDWAATLGSGRVAELLLARGAPQPSLVIAAALGKLDLVRAALESGRALSAERVPVAPDDHWPADSARVLGDTLSEALFAAARNGHTEVVGFLLERGASVDAKGVFGGTGLHWSALNGHAETVALLVSRGASLTIRDVRFDGTPADWAIEGGHAEIAAALAERMPPGS
ncbi:MAG: ankyrin repeat domain-containing protein [Acidobacteria bacterium]|nr:ankyrin repeat domain-containing protein [Acidobacteriota bacterium]